MEAPSKRVRTMRGSTPAGSAPGWRSRTLAARRIVSPIVVAALAAACVAPTVGSPGGPPADGPGRPSLPPGLAAKTWIAGMPSGRAVAGVSGGPERLTLPEGDLPLAATAGRVASATSYADGSGSVLRVREIASGQLIAEVARPEDLGSAVFLDDRLLAAGNDPARPGTDPGIIAVSLVDGSVTQLVGSGPVLNGWTGSVARTLAVSPSGRTVISGLCLIDRCAIDVLDPQSGSVRRLIDEIDAFPGPITDDVVIVGSDQSSDIAAYDLATGTRLWQRTGAEFQYSYTTSDGHLVQSYIDHGGPYVFTVSVIDPRTNDERIVLRRDVAEGLTLWPELSADDGAVLGTGGRFGDVSQSNPVVRAALLDLATGDLVPGGIVIAVAP